MDFTRALREFLRLTGPAVENVDVHRPLNKTAEETVNINTSLNRSPIENENIDEVGIHCFKLIDVCRS